MRTEPKETCSHSRQLKIVEKYNTETRVSHSCFDCGVSLDHEGESA